MFVDLVILPHKMLRAFKISSIRVCAYQEVRNVPFFGKFEVLCFLVTSVLRFAFLPYHRRIVHTNWQNASFQEVLHHGREKMEIFAFGLVTDP